MPYFTPPAFDLSQCYFDGNYSTAQVAGPPEYEIPFKDDPKPYSYKIPYWQELTSYLQPSYGAAGPMGGTFVGDVPGSLKSVGGGIVEFRREFALVPDTRNEYESFTYSYQIIATGPASITEMPITVSSRVQFDYFRTSLPSTISLPKAPKAFSVLENVYLLNGMYDLVLPYPGAPTGTEVLATDATLKIWKGDIYERTQRFIKWISLTDLFASATP